MSKAFDSVSHPFLERVLQAIKIDPHVRDLIWDLMRKLEVRKNEKRTAASRQARPQDAWPFGLRTRAQSFPVHPRATASV
jgi:hypothetical protein